MIFTMNLHRFGPHKLPARRERVVAVQEVGVRPLDRTSHFGHVPFVERLVEGF